MSKLAIIVSDLHMGARDALDRFAYDEAFAAFCRDVADYARTYGVSLRFVLNGDIIDLWTTVDAAELATDAAPVIEAGLEYPAHNRRAVAKAVRRGKAQIDAILGAHPQFSNGLRDLLETPDPEIVYLVGNHDHGMMQPKLQDHFRKVVGTVSRLGEPAPIAFPGRFEDRDLRLYVEHGNQFSLDSSYEDFFDPGEADMGLYFLRFVGNRVRALYPQSPTWSVIGDFLSWTLGSIFDDTVEIPLPLRFMLEYFDARKRGVVPDFSKHTLLQGLYDQWEANAGQPPNVLKEALADVFRSHEQPEFSRSLTTSPDDTGFLRNVPIRGTPRMIEWHARVDRYWKGAMSRLSDDDPGFPMLNPKVYSTVVLGHTHEPRYQFLPARRVSSGRYFNSGSWTRDKTPVYVWVSNDGNPREWRGIKTYRI